MKSNSSSCIVNTISCWGRSLRIRIYAATIALVAMHPSILEAREAAKTTLDIQAGRLGDALRMIAGHTDSELIYLPSDVAALSVPPMRLPTSPETALSRILRGSGLTFRRLAGGAFVISKVANSSPSPPEAIAEILVVGDKTQNRDIRRRQNDIQAYRIATTEDLASSHANDLDEFLKTHLTANALVTSPSQDKDTFPANNSLFDLYGLGTRNTLVLVDGMRMPSVPSLTEINRTPNQPDVNAIPLSSVERVETLSSAAGGIYGPGATGGVVNIILRRDYRHSAFSIAGGVTQHGGADRQDMNLALGFSPDEGRTQIMLAGAWSRQGILLTDQRDFAKVANAQAYARSPQAYLDYRPIPNAIDISTSARTLSLKRAYGGQSLGAPLTYLPLQHGTGALQTSALLANAGTIPHDMSDDYLGGRVPLLNGQSTSSIIMSARREVHPGLEIFLDGLYLRNQVRTRGASAPDSFTIDSDAPTNPFRQSIEVIFPTPDFWLDERAVIETYRYAGGAIFDLPHHWKGEASVSLGGVNEKIDISGWSFSDAGIEAMELGLPGEDGKPAIDPFGDWQSLRTAMSRYRIPASGGVYQRSRLVDLAVRAAGPLAHLGGGDLTATTLVEYRSEHLPPSNNVLMNWFGEGSTNQDFSNLKQATSSAYMELRAPLISTDTSSVVRGLEVQLALRYDDLINDVDLDDDGGGPVSVRYRTANVTAGIKFFPTSYLMVRGSVATGSVPPAVEYLSEIHASVPSIPDPRRGGSPTGSDGMTNISVFGNTHMLAERAVTLSVGAILNPDGRRGPRISLDYTHLRKFHEDSAMPSLPWLLDHEAEFPGRVTRASLTPEDIAQGYSEGSVTHLDGTYLSTGWSIIDAVDFDLDYRIPFENGSSLRLHGQATWQPRFTRFQMLDSPAREFLDFADSPIRLRANGGIAWSQNAFSVGLSGRYYSRYNTMVWFQDPESPLRDVQGEKVAAQFYLDLDISYRIRVGDRGGRLDTVNMRFGVNNLLDHDPPPLFSGVAGPFYSTYGDPRLRRFSLVLSTGF